MNPVLEKAVWALGGGFVSLVVAHFAVGKEVAYIRGQLAAIITQLHIVQRLKDKIASTDEKANKTHADLGHAFDKIRQLERRAENGHGG